MKSDGCKQAMIFAAGMGSRLMPLTARLPKPLFPILNTPNIERIVISLVKAGFSKIVINAFHLASSIEHWSSGAPFRECITIVREHTLLGTGGGIKNALSHFVQTSPVLVINSDIVTDIDFAALMSAHEASGFPATLVVHDRAEFNNIKVEGGLVIGFGYRGDHAKAFTGISVLEPDDISAWPADRGSLVEVFEHIMARSGGCNAVYADELTVSGYLWEDIGTTSGYLCAHEHLMRRRALQFLAGRGSNFSKDLGLSGWICAGSGVTVGQRVRLGRVVLWDGVHVMDGMEIENAICTPEYILYA